MSSNLIKATLAADAASLGYHWVYDTSKVPDSLPKPLPLQAPESKFHSGLHAGDLTHYGVQVAVLYGSTSAKGAYDGDSFAAAMRTFWKDNSKYYVDGATKSLLAGKPPTSDDFSAVGRNAALLAVLDPVKEPQAFIDAAKDQASATHNADVALCASMFAEALTRILKPGETVKPSAVLKELAEQEKYAKFRDSVRKGCDSGKEATRDMVTKFGPSCSMEGCLPSCVHLLVKYEGTTPCVANAAEAGIVSGGDSSSRILPAVLLLAAYAQRNGADPMQGLPDFAKVILPSVAKTLSS